MKTVLHALNSLEPHIIKGLLESEGIMSNIVGEFLQGTMGELPVNDLIRVVVSEDDYEKAAEVIDNWRQAKFIA
jgi:hypothetical protein|tara:strand:+ start:710 stop:931 length:222 start_codon:yes stop_codon:yes gene_type:complete